MAEYIEREALLAKSVYMYGFGKNKYVPLRAIESAPAADVVEVLRCKYCKHWYDKEEVCLKIYSDGAVSQYAWQKRKPDDFCSYGDRRESDV